jgi:Zn-dependent protease
VDPIGTLLFPFLMLAFPAVGRFLIGWAKPVPVSPVNFLHPRRDEALVSFAGPAMNLILCAAAYLGSLAVLGGGWVPEDSAYLPVLHHFFGFFTGINFLLAVFNLLPIAPLDGSWILKSALPPKWSYELSKLDAYGMYIVLGLAWFGGLSLWLGFFADAANSTLALLGLPPVA